MKVPSKEIAIEAVTKPPFHCGSSCRMVVKTRRLFSFQPTIRWTQPSSIAGLGGNHASDAQQATCASSTMVGCTASVLPMNYANMPYFVGGSREAEGGTL